MVTKKCGIIVVLLVIMVTGSAFAQQSAFQGVWIDDLNSRLVISGNNWSLSDSFGTQSGTVRFSDGRADLFLPNRDRVFYIRLTLTAPGRAIDHMGTGWRRR